MRIPHGFFGSCLMILVHACSSPVVKDGGRGAAVNETVMAKELPDPAKGTGMDVHRVMAIWDSLCDDMEGSWVMDGMALSSKKDFRDPLLYFDRHEAKAYFKSGAASVLVYSDSPAARTAFKMIVDSLGTDPVGKSIGHFDPPAQRLVNTVFSKSGSMHVLIGDMIVHLQGSCAESRKEMERRLLFVRILNERHVLGAWMSMRCGWSDLKIALTARRTPA